MTVNVSSNVYGLHACELRGHSSLNTCMFCAPELQINPVVNWVSEGIQPSNVTATHLAFVGYL